MKQQRLFSGIQPSGALHIGNYLGAIQQWIALQNSHESFFCIVDLHAITVRQDPKILRENILNVAAIYLACGLDPERATIFVQSDVPAHATLAWILGTFTQMGELERMTQYKEKAATKKENNNVGLFMYPVLMAADILLYNADVVPVGDDQKQHLELTRNIAERFNNHYEKKILTLPQALFQKNGARIMGLDDPTVKMSKSAATSSNYIALHDDADIIRKKIRRAVTDSGDAIRAGADKPALTNLLTIYSLLSDKTIAQLEKDYAGRGYADFKNDLAEVVIAWLTPLQNKIHEFLRDKKELQHVLENGRERANAVAQETLRRVYDVVGLYGHHQ